MISLADARPISRWNNMRSLLGISLIFVGLISRIDAQIRGDISSRSLNSCSSHDTCTGCLQSQNCAWCSEPGFGMDPDTQGTLVSRCNPRRWYSGASPEVECRPEFLVDVHTDLEATLNQSLSDSVQLQPQKLVIRTRPQEMVSFEVNYSAARNYPIDLYLILDVSKSMEDDKQKVADMAAHLTKTMKKITSDFRLGFGSFVDKATGPFSDPYIVDSTPDDGPYLFQHHMKLSSNPVEFEERVRSTKTRDDLDHPEGGLEALLQVLVCQNQIGWRRDARRLVVLATDAPFHLAGDAKLAGISRPNDGRCHLNADGRYVADLRHDYPSIAQINRQLGQHAVSVILAVAAPVAPIYKLLKDRLQGASVAVLSPDSSNIVQLIREEYSKITSSVELRHTASHSVGVKFFSECGTAAEGDRLETSLCRGLRPGTPVRFQVQLQVITCPVGRDLNESFDIYPVGVNEALTVQLQVSCQCPCDQVDNAVKDPQCSGAGTYKCGVCQCDPGFSGMKCSCSVDDSTKDQLGGSMISYNSTCRLAGETVDCSGRGICRCGVCHCFRSADTEAMIWGAHCECDNRCPRGPNNLLCSGHGTCQCGGVCQCLPDWKGESCEFSTDDSTCYASRDQAACSGNGYCENGKCVCYQVNQRSYSGKYCEDGPTSPCSHYVDCVKRMAFAQGPAALDDCSDRFDIVHVDDLQESDENQMCQYQDGDCTVHFVLTFVGNEVQVKRQCPPNALVIGGGVTGGILAVGLLLLMLWKALVVTKDRIEYTRFKRERLQARWNRDENPMYKRPTTRFNNPTYEAE